MSCTSISFAKAMSKLNVSKIYCKSIGLIDRLCHINMRTRNGRCPLPLVERFFASGGDVFGFGGDVFHFEKYSSSVLGTSPVSDTPLEVGLKIIT